MDRPPRFRRPRRRAVTIVMVLAALLLVRLALDDPQPSEPESLFEGVHRVQRVVDGDTLLLTNRARIRLIGADTPETVKPDHPIEPFGPEASEFTKRFIGAGPVRLTFDRERQDRYGRFLAYVWVGDLLLNEELIRAGLAIARLDFRYAKTMKDRFRKAEEEARAARRGIWSDDEPVIRTSRAKLFSLTSGGHSMREVGHSGPALTIFHIARQPVTVMLSR